MDDLSKGIKDLVEKLDTTGEMSLEEIKKELYRINPAFEKDRIFNVRLPSIYSIHKREKKWSREEHQK